jgi:hypothetical protein
MSRYTIQLRDVAKLCGEDEVKSWFSDYDMKDFLTDDEIAVIEARGTWNPEKLAEKIFNHYYIYEIGYETPALFEHMVKVEMQELMEEYLPLIYSASIKYDPLVNVDFTESYHQEQAGSSESASNSNGSALAIHSDTPQGQINKSSILEGKYASNTDGTETDSSTSDNTSTTGNMDYTKTTKGNSGISATAQRMIQQYRDNIRAIDREIIDKLNVHFMGIF